MRLNRFASSFCLPALAALALSLPVYSATGAKPTEVTRQDGANDLSLVVGRSVLLDTAQPVQRVAVGLGDFAEATVISPTEIMVNAKAPGETTLILWESGGNREFFNLTVRPSTTANADRLEGIRRDLRSELAGQDIRVSQENGSVILRGTVNDLTSSDRAVQVASVGGAKVVNMLDVHVPASRPQILLKCNFASVDRTRSRELGINMFNRGLGHWVGAISTGQFPAPIQLPDGSTSFSDDLNLFAYFPGLDIGTTIKALEQQNLVQVLAEPNVLAQDGAQGSILAGGEYPYPVPQASISGTTITIMFKEYGVRLIFLPHITPQGTIDLQIVSEVSALDFTNAVTISGYKVPAITERRVKTEVNLSKGQSFAIGGLLDNSTTQTLEKVPFIGDVPILGKFFQSISKTKKNSELIVIVTPEIVQPAPQGTIPLPKYAEPFMAPNSTSPMHHPDGTANSTATYPPPQPSQTVMPVEQLQQELKPGPQLSDTGGSYSASGFGAGTASGSTGSAAPQ